MNSILPHRASYLFLGLATLVACTSGNKPNSKADASATGGASAQSTGGSSATDSCQPVTLVDVPNNQDEYPVAKASGLAPTPPMGWNSWNSYSSGVSAALVRATADIFVSSGMKDAGYQYVNIDDGWMLRERVAPGSGQSDSGTDYTASDAGDSVLQPDPAKFPPSADGTNGIKVVADYVHSKGLKFGIYSDRGPITCGSYAASGGHELTDARMFAEWGVDYLKYDNCPNPAPTGTELMNVYQAMRDALNTAMTESKHDIVYALCTWHFDEWNLQTGQLWRTTGDIAASFNDRTNIPASSNTILSIASKNKAFAAYSGPNNWNDADMLEVGNLGTSDQANRESHTHFNLWAIMSSPLIAGNKLDKMTPETLAILTNSKVIAVDQDYLGLQGAPITSTDSSMVWAKPLNKAGARAVLLVNSGTSTQNISVSLAQIGLSTGSATVTDLWVADDPGHAIQDTFAADVLPHGSVMVEIDGNEPGIPAGTACLSDLTWTYAANGAGYVKKDLSYYDKPLTINGTTFNKGLGIAAGSKILYRLAKRCSNFSATVGVDDGTGGGGSVQFQVWADGQRLYPVGDLVTTKGNDPPQTVNVDLTGKYRLMLLVTNAGDGSGTDYADWADAKITCSP